VSFSVFSITHLRVPITQVVGGYTTDVDVVVSWRRDHVPITA